MTHLDYAALLDYARDLGESKGATGYDASTRTGLIAMRDEADPVAEAFGCASATARRDFVEALLAWIDEEVDSEHEDDACPECSRSFGPHYSGPCEHGATIGGAS